MTDSEPDSRVYLLWHSRDLALGVTDDTLLGVYSSEELALAGLRRARTMPALDAMRTPSCVRKLSPCHHRPRI